MSTHKQNQIYDLLVIGGGINGVGIAANAAGRGLSVVLCEQYDLASETSSRSSKMIHGGLRYLEYYEFRLVRKALREREVMLKIAPHIVQPLQLIIPHNSLQRPAWMVRLGLFLYDHLGKHFGKKSKLPGSYGLKLNDSTSYGKPLKPELSKGFCYYDCKVDDARLVVLNALAAKEHGALILPRTKFIGARRENGLWISTLEDQHNKNQWQVISKALVNAAGPWVDDIVNEKLGIETKNEVELVKGSHIVVPRLYQGEHAYLLQNKDKRVVFAIPYQHNFTLIGTTDVPYHQDPAKVKISEDEREYLCDIINRYFKTHISSADIVDEWSGVRPLQADDANDPSAVTRDYSLEIEDEAGLTPILSVFGGKLTTYRKLSERAMHQLKAYFPHMGPAWTAETPLPGGNIKSASDYANKLKDQFSYLPSTLLERYAFSYGSLSELILDDVKSLDDMGKNFGHDLYEKEIDYLIKHEWAQSVEDILWRRTKQGLYISSKDNDLLNSYIKNNNRGFSL